MAIKLQLRRGTATQWTSANTVLAAGEMGIETDTNKAKVGDGNTAWTALSYLTGGGNSNSILALDNTFTGNNYFTGTGKRVGIGTIVPEVDVDLIRTGVSASIRARTNDTTGSTIGRFMAQHGSGASFEMRAGDQYSYLVSSNTLGGTNPPLLIGAGAEHMRIISTGRVAFGMTTYSPYEKVSVLGNLGAHYADPNYPAIRTIISHGGDSATTGGASIIAQGSQAANTGSGDIRFYTSDSNAIDFNTDAPVSEKMRIVYNGQVGIGTPSPSTNVHVRFNNTNDVGFRIQQNNTTQFAGAGMAATTPFGGASFYAYNADTTGNVTAAIAQSSNTGGFVRALWVYDYAGQNHQFYSNGTSRMIIDSSGRVGIGTSSPGYKFEVANTTGDVTSAVIAQSGGAAYLRLFGPTATFTAFNRVTSNQTDGASHEHWSVGGEGVANTFSIRTNGAVPRLTVDSSGRVGIANTNPPVTLFVSGNIAATGTITASYSDERLKEKLGNINNSIEIITSLNGFKYKNNDLAKSFGYTDDAIQIGLSAQEVKEVLPEVISLAPFDMTRDENDNLVSRTGNNYLTLDYAKIVPVLVEALKEQQSRIEKLENEVRKLLEGITP